jgi:hypothetical protein
MGLMTAREYESKKTEETQPAISLERPVKVEVQVNRFYLQHPDSVGDITCDFQIEVDGKVEIVKLEHGRTVIKNERLADTLLKRGYIEYRRREKIDG